MKFEKVSLVLLVATALLGATAESQAAAPKWYAQIEAHTTSSAAEARAIFQCPQLAGGRIVGNACAARQSKKIGFGMSGVASLAAGAATIGTCVPEIKALQHAASASMMTALTFTARQPDGTVANINARTGVIKSVTTVITRQATVALCLARR